MVLQLSKDEIIDVSDIVYAKRVYRNLNVIAISIRTKSGEVYYFEKENQDKLNAIFQVIYDNIKDRK